EKDELRVCSCGRGAEDEMQAALATTFVNDLVETRLHNRNLSVVEALDLFGDDIGACDVMAEVREVSARGQADVSGSDNRDLAHGKSGVLPEIMTDISSPRSSVNLRPIANR